MKGKSQRRELMLAALFFLPKTSRIRLERWLRGRHEARRLAGAQVAIVSYGKSGRTWLRVMISRYFQVAYDIPEHTLLGYSNFHRQHSSIPRVLFTHDNYIEDYKRTHDSKAPFYHKKVVLLVRDPKDIAVSQFFQWRFRMRPSKKILNGYPPHGADVSLFDFVMNPLCGLPRVISYLNLWASEAAHVEQLMVVRYEDMRQKPDVMLSRVMEFLGEASVESGTVSDAVEYASLENMRKLEEDNVYGREVGRMQPGEKGNPDSYKVRRAKVGGYRDYFSPDQAEQIDELVARDLAPWYGYASPGEGPLQPPMK